MILGDKEYMDLLIQKGWEEILKALRGCKSVSLTFNLSSGGTAWFDLTLGKAGRKVWYHFEYIPEEGGYVAKLCKKEEEVEEKEE